MENVWVEASIPSLPVNECAQPRTAIDLSAAIARNRLGLSRLFFAGDGYRELPSPHCEALLSGVPSPHCNGVFLPDFPAATLAQDLKEILAAYREAGLPGYLWVDAGSRSADLLSELIGQGCVARESVHEIAADLKQLPLPSTPELFLRPLASSQDKDTWARILADGFSFPDPARSQFRNALDLLPGHGRIANYLASFQGEDVATATIFYSHGIAGIYHVAVAGSRRGQALGTALLAGLVGKIRQAGYRYATGSTLASVLPFCRQAPILSVGRTERFEFSSC